MISNDLGLTSMHSQNIYYVGVEVSSEMVFIFYLSLLQFERVPPVWNVILERKNIRAAKTKTFLREYHVDLSTLVLLTKCKTWELSGRVLDLRPRGCRFEPHRRHCVLSLSKTH